MLWLPWIRRIPPSWLRALMALTVGLLGVPGDRRDARGLRAGRRGLAGVRRRGARAARRRGRLPAADRRVGVAARSGSTGASGSSLALLVATGIGLHNLGEGVAIGSAYSVGALALGRVPGRRLRAAQHHRGAGDRRADRPPEADAGAARAARPDRRRAGGARRVDRRRRVQREPGRVPVRLRRRRDRAGDRPARAVAARRRRAARCTRAPSPGCWPGWR